MRASALLSLLLSSGGFKAFCSGPAQRGLQLIHLTSYNSQAVARNIENYIPTREQGVLLRAGLACDFLAAFVVCEGLGCRARLMVCAVGLHRPIGLNY